MDHICESSQWMRTGHGIEDSCELEGQVPHDPVHNYGRDEEGFQPKRSVKRRGLICLPLA